MENPNENNNSNGGQKGPKLSQTIVVLITAAILVFVCMSCVNSMLENSTSDEIRYDKYISISVNSNIFSFIFNKSSLMQFNS